MGSYQSLDEGHVFLGYGYIPQLVEFDATGTEVCTATFGHVNVTFSYRAFRQACRGVPNALPDTYACALSNGTTAVYMSWNDATAYTAWTIYGGESEDSLQILHIANRAGFETYVDVGNVAFVKVGAIAGIGMPTLSSIVVVQQKC
ncbi:hypothetical protein MMC32_000975 [Xylographa parallela]|nr:hypothetical protein [Xylographa parallela]